jgi:aryl-alcohol dehydrogenase-like predicted oxidoreductase
MPFRQINLPSLGLPLSNVMACPSSAEPDSHESGLEEYDRLGGNGIHLHGEGGETHSRRAVGRWLERRGRRADLFLCARICHEGWDAVARCAIDRLTPEAVIADITADLALLGTDYLDLVYVANAPGRSCDPVIEAIATEIVQGRVRAFGVRNWTPEKIQATHAHLVSLGTPGVGAIVTTELALLTATCPLWPQDIPFSQLEATVRDLGLAVFAHADAFNVGEHLFDENVGAVPERWRHRWENPTNRELVRRVRAFAAAHGLTSAEVNLAWLFNRSFPVIALVSLPDLLSERRVLVEHASRQLIDLAASTGRNWLPS